MLTKAAWTPANLVRSASCRTSNSRVYISKPATRANNGFTPSGHTGSGGTTPVGRSHTSRIDAAHSSLACLRIVVRGVLGIWDLGTGRTGDACALALAVALVPLVWPRCHWCCLGTGATGLALATSVPFVLLRHVPALQALWLQALRTARAAPMASMADAGTIGGAAGKNGGCVGGAAGGACWPSGKRCVWWHRCWFSGSTGGASGRLGLLDLEDESLPARSRLCTACALGSNNSNNSHCRCDAIFISQQFLEPQLIWHIYICMHMGDSDREIVSFRLCVRAAWLPGGIRAQIVLESFFFFCYAEFSFFPCVAGRFPFLSPM